MAFRDGFIHSAVGSTADETDNFIVVVDVALRGIGSSVHLDQWMRFGGFWRAGEYIVSKRYHAWKVCIGAISSGDEWVLMADGCGRELKKECVHMALNGRHTTQADGRNSARFKYTYRKEKVNGIGPRRNMTRWVPTDLRTPLVPSFSEDFASVLDQHSLAAADADAAVGWPQHFAH